MKKYIIVGGVAGGATAAARLRRLDEAAEIILIERGSYISFANCGLPYYIGNAIQDRDRLLVQKKEIFCNRFRVDVRTDSEVTAVNTENKTVTIRTGDMAYEETYDALLLAPGAQPVRPAIPGIDNERIMTLRSVPDADRLRQWADKYEGSGRAVVVGGGFIGVEMAENLRQRGMTVTLLEGATHILAPFDTDMVKIMERELVQNDIRLLLGNGVQSFASQSDGVSIALADGRQLTADFVVLAIGVRPDTAFLKQSDITLTERGYIVTDDHMRTTVPDVYAAGDAVQTRRVLSDDALSVALAGPANHQGRIAADNMTGRDTVYEGVQGTSILKVFDLTAAATGENEQGLKQRHAVYHAVKVYPDSHAGYYPGAVKMALKVLFDDRGRILGAQAAGYDGVDKRIDVLAAMIRHGHTVQELAELELAYAPPYSSAKDPVNMAGYAAENVLDGLTDPISYEEASEMIDRGAVLIDVRTHDEVAAGGLPRAIHIPLENLREHLHELDIAVPIIVYCQIGQRGYFAERLLKQHGYAVKNLMGGYMAAKDALFSVPSAETLIDDGQSETLYDGRSTAFSRPETAQMPSAIEFDVTGLSCPGPLMKLREYMETMQVGAVAKFTASDPGFYTDSQAWCERTGNRLLHRERKNGLISVWIQKPAAVPSPSGIGEPAKDDKTIVVFSGDLDKVLAAFVIANGALTMGKKVTMFFTFWGLNVLRRPEKVTVRKGLVDTLFGWMMPRGSRNLTLSKMNMMGMGTKLMRQVMHDKNIQSLESLIQSAQAGGVHMIACQMSMDVMGIRREELMDGVDVGGVATFLGAAEDANMSLFI